MNLFDELERLNGETLASAVLRLLILRSQPLRRAFLRLLDRSSPVGPITSTSHFSCYQEHTTDDPELGSGRIDLVLELDDSIIGVEAKLHGEFRVSQPEKYKREMSRLAKVLSEARRRKFRQFLSILAPESRRVEIEDRLTDNEIVVISWEDILSAFSESLERVDACTAFLLAEYRDFLSTRTSFLPELSRWLRHLRSSWEPNGTALQREFLRIIWDVLPNGGGRLSAGPTWVGYYFRPDDPGCQRGWIGFIPNTRFREPPSTNASLIVASGNGPISETAHFAEVDLVEPIWVDGRHVESWRVHLDESWSTPQRWHERLGPLFDLTLGR